MKFTTRQLLNTGNNIEVRNIAVDEVKVDEYCLLAIDGSTSNSGLAIIRQYDRAIMYSMCATRDTSGETPVHYKIRLKRQVADLIKNNKLITHVFYEEPVIANVTAIPNLFMLRTFIEEMIIEGEPYFDYIQHYEVPNMRWKKEFLSPDKVPSGTDAQKKAVKQRLLEYLPFLSVVTQDEIDAICMGFVAAQYIKNGNEKDIQSKKKARAFKYNSIFIGADDDDSALMEVCDIYKGPKFLLENNISFTNIPNKADFNKHIYTTMEDEDKLIIAKFSSKHHGNIILEHRIGNLSAQYEYIYGVIWRVSRK